MKQTRLLEIIREEIAGALNEIEKGEIELPKGTPPTAIKQYTDKGFDVKIVDPSTGKMVQKEAQLEEDALNEMILAYQQQGKTIPSNDSDIIESLFIEVA